MYGYAGSDAHTLHTTVGTHPCCYLEGKEGTAVGSSYAMSPAVAAVVVAAAAAAIILHFQYIRTRVVILWSALLANTGGEKTLSGRSVRRKANTFNSRVLP